MGIKSHFPKVIQSTTGADTAKRQDVLGSGRAPEHARLFAASADDRFASGFDDTRADEEASAAKGAILHTLEVADEVTQFLFHRLGAGGAGGFLARGSDEVLDFIAEHRVEVIQSPYILSTHWRHPTGSLAHFIKRD